MKGRIDSVPVSQLRISELLIGRKRSRQTLQVWFKAMPGRLMESALNNSISSTFNLPLVTYFSTESLEKNVTVL